MHTSRQVVGTTAAVTLCAITTTPTATAQPTSQLHLKTHHHAACSTTHDRRNSVCRTSSFVSAHVTCCHSRRATTAHGCASLTTTTFSAMRPIALQSMALPVRSSPSIRSR